MNEAIIIASVLGLTLAIGAWRGVSGSLGDFLYNSHRTRFLALFCSIVASQFGAGSVVTVYSISVASPFTGVMIAFGVGCGLLLLAWALPHIGLTARRLGANGILEVLLHGHGCSTNEQRLFLLPVYLLVILKLATQLLALSLLVGTAFELGQVMAVLVSLVLLMIYVMLAGYRAATSTDAFQFIVIGVFTALVWYYLELPDSSDFLWVHQRYPDYFPWVLFAMLVMTGFTSIAHWRRAITAADDRQARVAFALSAPLVTGFIIVFAMSGYLLGEQSGNSAGGLKILFPPQFGWVIHVGMIMAILSSMDTLLLSSLVEPSDGSLRSVRLRVLGVGLLIFTIAIFLGDIVKTMVSTYSALLSFFPATVWVLRGRAGNGQALVASVIAGVVVSFIVAPINFMLVPIAALVSSALVYEVMLRSGYSSKPR